RRFLRLYPPGRSLESRAWRPGIHAVIRADLSLTSRYRGKNVGRNGGKDYAMARLRRAKYRSTACGGSSAAMTWSVVGRDAVLFVRHQGGLGPSTSWPRSKTSLSELRRIRGSGLFGDMPQAGRGDRVHRDSYPDY